MPSSGTQVTGSQVPCRSEGMLGQSPRPAPTTGPCQAPQGSWYREMPITGAVKKPRRLQPLGLRDPAPQKSCPAGRQGLGCPPNHPFLLLHSTLPDSPPDSGSEAYSPQQVNGESSGHRPPPLGFGQVAGAALSGGREQAREGGGQRPPNRPRLSLVKYSPALAIVSPWAGGEPGPASEQVSLPVMPPACPPAPSWTRPSAVSGRLGEAGCSLDTGLAAAGPTSPWEVLRGAVAPRWPRAEGSRAAVSPQPREGSRVLFILPKTSLECLLGNKGSWGLPPQAGGLAPGASRREEGPPRRTALGVPEDSFLRFRGGAGLRGAGGEPWDAGPPQGAGPGPARGKELARMG